MFDDTCRESGQIRLAFANRFFTMIRRDDILVDVVNSTDMKEKIEKIVLGIKSVSVSYYEVLILSLLVKVMSINISILDIEKIMGINVAFDSRFTNDENVLEILSFSDENTDYRIK